MAENAKSPLASGYCMERQPVRAKAFELLNELGEKAIDYSLAHAST